MKTKYKFLSVFLLSIMLFSFPTPSYGAVTNHVIYDVVWEDDENATVTLKWSDEDVKTPIRITSWVVNNDETLTIRYQQGENVITGFDQRRISDSRMRVPCVVILEEDLGANSISTPIFPDLPSNDEASQSIEHLYYLGIINGYPNGDFGPSGDVSRAEFSKLLFLSGKMSLSLDSPITFTDVSSDYWARDYIYSLASRGIVKGIGNNLFNPYGTITISEVATMIDNSFTIYGSSSSYPYNLDNHWSNEYFVSLVAKGIIKNTDSYYYPYLPTKIATREDCAILLSRVLINYHDVKE